ncbi:hypothetical protein Tco_0477611 [Tanacetum coccineum]
MSMSLVVSRSIRKRVAYLVGKNYVKNTWSNYGLVKSMMNSSNSGPLDANLLTEDVGSVPVWVKFHDVPITAFSEDGLSVIAIKLIYARDMIELRADAELKDIIVVAVPKLVGEGFFMCTIDIEYEWKHPRQVVRGVQDDDLGPNGMNSKLAEKEANDMVSSSHATSSKAFGSPTTTLLAEMINDLERQTPDETLVLVDDDGKSLKKVKI